MEVVIDADVEGWFLVHEMEHLHHPGLPGLEQVAFIRTDHNPRSGTSTSIFSQPG